MISVSETTIAEFETKKGKFIAIPIPDKDRREKVGVFCQDEDVKYQLTKLIYEPYLNFHYHRGVIFNVPLPCECELLGTIRTLTEEQRKTIVDDSEWYTDMYKNYEHPKAENKSAQMTWPFQSMWSLMQANKIYVENPFGDKPQYRATANEQECDEYKNNYDQWETAQNRVSKDWVILKMI
jgi:hypothetical protein